MYMNITVATYKYATKNHPSYGGQHTALQNGLFRPAIWPVSEAQTACFASQNGTFDNTLTISRLRHIAVVTTFNTFN